MLHLNTENQATSLSTINHVTEVSERSEDGVVSNNIYPELAKLSVRKQWILYTANCPRPIQSELMQHKINCQNIIHIKPSHCFSEEEIVIKAIEAGTASAIIASANLGSYARMRIKSVANLTRCAVFFLDNNSIPRFLHH